MTFLYLLSAADGEAFKIGISADPDQRAAGLPQALMAERSRRYTFEAADARRAEQLLHFMFRAERVEGLTGGGFTEWFRVGAYPEVVAFLDAHRDRLGWTAVEDYEPGHRFPRKRGPKSLAPWQLRAKAAGLTQKLLAQVLGRPEITISRQLTGKWQSGTPQHVAAMVIAWELLSAEQREAWVQAVAGVQA